MAEEFSVIRPASPAASPTLRDLLGVLFRQRRTVLISFVGILLVSIAYAVIAPSYQAHMQLLIRRGRLDPVVTPTPTAPPQFDRPEVSEEELNSEAEILKDREILARVVQQAGLAKIRHFWQWPESDPEVRTARAVNRLAQELGAEPLHKTNLIAVSYRSSDPQLAATVLKVLAHVYLEKHREVQRPSGESRFFEEQVSQYRHALENAEWDLLDFTRDRGVVSAALERDMALQKLSDAETSYRAVRVEIGETEQRIRALESKLASFPERATTQMRTFQNPELQEKLKSKLLELELKRTELLTKFSPSYRLVQEVETQIGEAKAALEGEELAPLWDQTTDRDPNYEWSKSELAKAQVELQALQARAASLNAVLADCRQSARDLGQNAIRQQDLLREMKASEENYLLYVKKREEARIGDALDAGGILNVAIAEEPSVPALPARSPWTVGLLGLLLAGTVSTGLAFASDYLDPAFRTPDEVVLCLGTPVLASLPRKSA